MIEVKLTMKEAQKLETFVSDHITNCFTQLYEDDESLPEGWQSYDLFDGCDICEVREHMMATFDWLRSHQKVDIYVEG